MKGKSLHNLTEEELELVLNNCFASIFVTDGTGKIVFLNQDAADTLCVTEEYLLTRTVYDLLEEGITDYSSTATTICTRMKTVASYTNREGAEIMVVTTPVFNSKNDLIFCVTYSRKKTDMDMFIEQIKEERVRSDRYRDAVSYLDENNKSINTIIYKSKLMEELCQMAQIIAPTDSTVMLYGESGVGKEVFANYIHLHSKRKNEIFIPVNCAAIPANLMESEFFGYEKGAFTGAARSKSGLFEVVNNGTIFLDEIGELPLEMQSKLLRILENGEFFRIGSNKIIKTDVRVIGATNRDLKSMIKDRTFREDLYYRLNVLPIDIPPLRNRKEDVAELAKYYLAKANRRYGKRMPLSDDHLKLLMNYSWPGNVRELRNIVERYVLTGNPFVIESLTYGGGDGSGKTQRTEFRSENLAIVPLKEKMHSMECEYIHYILDANGGNVQKTAAQLGVHKSLIYRKLREETGKKKQPG